jgi:hypothetical protein
MILTLAGSAWSCSKTCKSRRHCLISGSRPLSVGRAWVKEAHYRESWPVEGGPALASVAYAVLRRDWETGTTTTFVWDDVTLTD